MKRIIILSILGVAIIVYGLLFLLPLSFANVFAVDDMSDDAVAPLREPREMHEMTIPFSWLFCAERDTKGMVIFEYNSENYRIYSAGNFAEI